MSVLNFPNHSFPDRIVREAERKAITSISRAQAYQLEKAGRFPKRIVLGSRSVGWLYSDLQAWVSDRKQAALEGELS